MSTTLSKFWKGTKDGIKWFLIQAGVLLAISLLYYLGLYCYSLFSGIEFREVLMSYPLLGRAGAYNLTIGSYEFNWCLQDIVNSHFINRHKYNVHLTLWAIYYYDDGKEHQFGRDTSTFQIYIPTLFGSASISYFHYKFNIY